MRGFPVGRGIRDTRAESAFRTKSLSFANASADGASSLSGGCRRQCPESVPLKIKNENGVHMTHSMRTNRLSLASMARSSKPSGCPHSGTDHLVRNFPFESNTWMRLINWIGDIHFVVSRIDRDRTKASELSIATSLAAPTRKNLAIGTELHDSIATRIDDIN